MVPSFLTGTQLSGVGPYFLIGDPGVGPYFFYCGPKCGSLLSIRDLWCGSLVLIWNPVWVPNSWDGSHCKVIVKNYSILEISNLWILNFRNIESLEYSDLMKQIFYLSRGSHNL